MDPSGTFNAYEAKAIGSGSEGAQQALQEVYHKVIQYRLLRGFVYVTWLTCWSHVEGQMISPKILRTMPQLWIISDPYLHFKTTYQHEIKRRILTQTSTASRLCRWVLSGFIWIRNKALLWAKQAKWTHFYFLSKFQGLTRKLNDLFVALVKSYDLEYLCFIFSRLFFGWETIKGGDGTG